MCIRDRLAHQRDGAGLAAGGDAAHHLLPLGQVGSGHIQLELLHHDLVQTTGVQHQRALVQDVYKRQVWYTKINPYMRFSQKGASKCLKSARIARAVF